MDKEDVKKKKRIFLIPKEDVVHIYTMEYYSAIKRNGIMHLQQPGWT